MDWNARLSTAAAGFAPSRAVVEILKLAERPEVVSMAGGLPDPRSFPLARISRAVETVLRTEGAAALNYGPNPGYGKLRDWLAQRMREAEGFDCAVEEIFVCSGGLEGIGLLSTALLDEGDTVVTGAPTFLSALHVFRRHGVRILGVPLDEEGLTPEALDSALARSARDGRPASFLYAIPTFQNPSGLTMSLERRHRIVEICRRHQVPIIEDHAYADLRYEGEALPSLKSLAPEQVIFVHTFSKIFGPGVRLGWIAADRGLIETVGLCKLGTDQCSGTLSQRAVYEYARQGGIDDQIRESIPIYREKRDILLSALKEACPPGVSWTRPQGGFYVWLTLPARADSERLLEKAIQDQGVAFVAGSPFFPDGNGRHHLRLSFSYLDVERLQEGMRRLLALGLT